MANKRDITSSVHPAGQGHVGLIELEVIENQPGAMFRNVYLLTQAEAALLLSQLTEYVI
jgi:hypothetical protein